MEKKQWPYLGISNQSAATHFNARPLKNVVPTFDIPKRKTVGEYVMIMHLNDGLQVRARTGACSYSIAKDLACEGILYVEEEFGPVMYWHWEGEENVYRTIRSAFPIKNKKSGILGKLSVFINGEPTETEVHRIRNRHKRKEKFAPLMDKLNAFFDIDVDEEEVEEYEKRSTEPKTLKEKLINFFYEE